jgi:plastocyanin
MSMNLSKLPLVGLLALAAACGGGGETEQAATTEQAPAASATPTVTTTGTPAPTTPVGGQSVTPDAGGQVHEVRMVTTQNGASGEFQPKTINVKKGDVIRWVMADGQVPHNVSFTMAQNQPAGFTAPADSPFLTTAGQTFEVKVDWNPGTYNYVCQPHMATGMVGSVTVS